ncbi:MAG: ribonuclease HII [Verrucomicrobiales bacterium]|nr:ribonuclease HII [Verrucomicrobiales bacterium]|tara:strand:- start:30907 stop:31521 length:615 start_codon:yes stop_codon:yes gene_type:complete
MPDLSHEAALRKEGFQRIAGIDEAGRGPLAGPVSVAVAVLPESYKNSVLNDSKVLSENIRQKLYNEIIEDDRIVWALEMVDASEIDRINILQATWVGMRRAFLKLEPPAEIALIDGKPIQGFPAEHRALVKGDSLSLSIAAASVIAKVERDRLMREYAEMYPEYGFERHKGYGTKAHLEALQKYGPCPIHRRSFGPVAKELDLS